MKLINIKNGKIITQKDYLNMVNEVEKEFYYSILNGVD